MTELRVIGVDPGPVPGLVRLHIVNGRISERWTHVVQSSAGCFPEIFETFLRQGQKQWPNTIVQIERFVVGKKSMKTAAPGATTRDMVGALASIALGTDARVLQRSAAEVKPWASNLRLQKADLWRATAGMRHARDAARHALFAACHDGNLPDPLSKEFS